jgi:aminoglycoside phosphotransferase (APT) family kinase protein
MAEMPLEVVRLLDSSLPGIEAGRAVLLGEGWNAIAWRVPASDGDWTLRIPTVDYGRAEIERQTCLAPKLAALGIPVPVGWQTLCFPDGRLAAGLYRYVDGVQAPRAGVSALHLLAPQVADILSRMHRLPVSIAQECGGGEWSLWPGLYSRLIQDLGGLLGDRSALFVRRLGEELGAAMKTAPRPVLLHGDLAPWHLICDAAGEVVAVLDFMGPVVAEPAIDFGRLVQHWGEGFGEMVLEHYKGPIDANFRRRMKIYALLEPLKTIEAGVNRSDRKWVEWGQRKLAALAASETRRGQPAT